LKNLIPRFFLGACVWSNPQVTNLVLQPPQNKGLHDPLGLRNLFRVESVRVNIGGLGREYLVQVLGLVVEDVGHDKVEERHQLDQVVLERGACEQELVLRLQFDERLVSDGVHVLEHVGLVEHAVLDLELFEEGLRIENLEFRIVYFKLFSL